MVKVPYNNVTTDLKTVTQTRLDPRLCPELIEYLEEAATKYGKMFRYTWSKIVKHGLGKIHEFNKELQHRFNVTKRIASYVIRDVQGRYSAYVELKKYELKQLKIKADGIKLALRAKKKFVNSAKTRAKAHGLSKAERKVYRKAKRELFELNQALYNLKAKIERYKRDAKVKVYKMCFGTKALWAKQYRLEANGFKNHDEWRKAFIANRDKNVYYVGSQDESHGNSVLQLTPEGSVYENMTKPAELFSFKLRNMAQGNENRQYIRGQIAFTHRGKDLARQLIERATPMTYRFVRKPKGWYIMTVLTDKNVHETVTHSAHGTLGLDFNKGFIEMSETDKHGNLVSQRHFDVPSHATSSNKVTTELHQIVHNVVTYAREVGKDVVIEDLDFSKKRSQVIKGKDRRHNHMLHGLEYAKYTKFFETTCAKNQVELTKVNPAWTSVIGEAKFGDLMKLNRHQAASFVIARSGQGIKDSYKDKRVY